MTKEIEAIVIKHPDFPFLAEAITATTEPTGKKQFHNIHENKTLYFVKK